MTVSKSEKQDIKAKRVKNIFISAAKELILSEGAENVSTRKIAQKCGYSLGTLYNYFKNIDELLWMVRKECITDIYERAAKSIDSIHSSQELSNLCIYIVDYIINNPNIYDFIYSFKLNPEDKPKDEYKNHFDIVMSADLKNDIADEGSRNMINQILSFSICGMLSVYFSNNYAMEKEYIYKQIPRIVDCLVQK